MWVYESKFEQTSKIHRKVATTTRKKIIKKERKFSSVGGGSDISLLFFILYIYFIFTRHQKYKISKIRGNPFKTKLF